MPARRLRIPTPEDRQPSTDRPSLLASGASPEASGAVVCGRLAARLHGLPLIDDWDPATGGAEHLLDDVATPRGGTALRSSTPEGQTRILHRYRRSYRRDQVLRLHGLPVTGPAQAVAECALLLTLEALVCLLDAALHRGLLSPADLSALVAARRWLPGVDRLRAAAARADGRAESSNESLARLVLRPHLPGLVPQQRLRDQRGRVLAASTSAGAGLGRVGLADRALHLVRGPAPAAGARTPGAGGRPGSAATPPRCVIF